MLSSSSSSPLSSPLPSSSSLSSSKVTDFWVTSSCFSLATCSFFSSSKRANSSSSLSIVTSSSSLQQTPPFTATTRIQHTQTKDNHQNNRSVSTHTFCPTFPFSLFPFPFSLPPSLLPPLPIIAPCAPTCRVLCNSAKLCHGHHGC
jgi:hypothetical protein